MSIQTIVRAIRNRERLFINYPPGRRLVEPHAIGYSKDGNILVRLWQVSGASASGERHDHWKLLRFDRLTSPPVSAFEVFDGPREDYKEDDKAMKGGIIAQIELPDSNDSRMALLP